MRVPSPAQTIPKFYTLEQIENVLHHRKFNEDLIQGIKDGFVDLEKGEFFACPIQTMGVPPFPFLEIEGYAAQTCVKSGYFKGQEYYVIKVASGGYPMKNSGLMQVYSQSTGQLEALLLDNGVLTEIRTAAAGALAAKLLAPKNLQMIGVIGTGIQGRYQLDMLRTVTTCRKVLVWGRTASKAKEFCNEMSKKGWEMTVAENCDDLLKECDLIITVTCARSPVLGLNVEALEARQKGKGLHITCIGADAPGKIELSPELVAKADLLVADTIEQTKERGEFRQALTDGLITSDRIISLGHLISSHSELQRKESTDDARITIFDSSGVALQDCVVSGMTYKALLEQGV